MCMGSRYVMSVEVGFPCLYLTSFSLVASDLFMFMLCRVFLCASYVGRNFQQTFLGCLSQSNLDHWRPTLEARKAPVGSGTHDGLVRSWSRKSTIPCHARMHPVTQQRNGHHEKKTSRECQTPSTTRVQRLLW